MVGVVPFGVIFGALAVASGIPAWMAVAMSAFVFAGSAQFVAIGLIAGGAGILLIVLTTFLVNVRHNLYAATLAPYIGTLPPRWLMPLAFWLTDETYVVVIQHFQQHKSSPYKRWYYLGSALTMYTLWQVATWFGIWAGNSISDPAGWGLDFALPATFIVMLLPQIRTRGVTTCVLVAAALSLLLHDLPYQSGLPMSVLAGAVAGAWVDRQNDSTLDVGEYSSPSAAGTRYDTAEDPSDE
jgi:4-azaleucine resistance transporter AzlC